MRVAHLTSVHARDDVRVFLKQCRSVAAAGHEVFLVVADGKGDAVRDGVTIVDAGAPTGRLDRILHASRRVVKRARRLGADIYHMHDPELVPAGLGLGKSGAMVVFDAHEDLPRQILAKPYLMGPARRPLSALVEWYERLVYRRLDGLVAATPHICQRYGRLNPNTVTVCNYPIAGELTARHQIEKTHVIYAGSISPERGLDGMVEAMALVETDSRLLLAGRWPQSRIGHEPGWRRVDCVGFLDREELASAMGRSTAGLVTLRPLPAYVDSLPIKLFEYMSAGLPVIASSFPLWRDIVEGHECGICVDPLDPRQIAAAIDRLVADREMAARMGENGRAAVAAKFNWEAEQRKLMHFYEDLLAGRTGAR